MGFIPGVKLLFSLTTPVTGDLPHSGTQNFAPPADFLRSLATGQRAIHLLNARLTYEFDEERSYFALWGKNLTNRAYFRGAIPETAGTFGYVIRYYERPRSFGFEVGRRF